jgi:hypothetical protein
MHYDWSELPAEKKDKWLELCPRDSYRVVPPSGISGLLSDSLVKKYDSVLVLSSGVHGSEAVVFMANGHRVEAKVSAIDQMPFGFGYLTGGGNTSGLLIQHGAWAERTSTPPAEFWTHIQQSGIGTCYPLSVLPDRVSGHISELQVATQTTGAFENLIAGLKSGFPDVAV